MSQFPPSQQIGYYGAARQPSDRRPTSVLVIAVIGIVLASLAAVGGLFSAASLLGLAASNPLADAMRQDPVVHAWTMISFVIDATLTTLLMVSSIRCLRMVPAGRKGMIVYAWASLIDVAVGLVMAFLFLWPLQDRVAVRMPAQLASVLNLTKVLTFAVAVPLTVAWLIVVLSFMNRPKVRAAFEGSPAAGRGY